MRKLLFLFIALLTGVSGAWATDVTVAAGSGVFWKDGAVSSDAWAPIWKSNALTSDGTTPLLVLTAGTGIDTSNCDLYASTYTLEAPAGYLIVSYSFNGTATGGDVTITPAGGSGTLISSGNSLGSPLSVTVGAQSTTFDLSGSGHIASLSFTVSVTEASTWKSSDNVASNTAENTSGKLSTVGFFRLTTPNVDGLSFSSFTLKHLGDSFQSDRYLAISSTKLTVTDNLPASVFAGVSNNKASSTGVCAYNFSSPVRLLGNTEYYFYFVTSNANGTYKLVTHGLAVQTGLSNTGFVWDTSITGDEKTNNAWWPYFTCSYSTVGNTFINSELIATTTAYKNRDASAQIGYPTSDAISALNTAITTAGTYSSANYKALMSAYISALTSINYTPRTDVYYTLTNANVPSGNRGSLVYDPSHSGSTDNNGHEFLWYTNSLDPTNPNHLWGFIESEGKYYMYNVGKRQFANVTQSGTYQLSNGDKHTWMFSNDPSVVVLDAGEGGWVAAPNVRVRATSEVTGKQYAMSISTTYTGPVIAYDAVNDGGIPMAFAVSSVTVDADVTAAIEALIEDLTPYRNALKDVIDACASIPFGSGLNEYASNSTYTTALADAQTAYDNEDATKSDLQTAKSNLESAIAGLNINQPGTGFYRIKGKTSSKYLAAGVAANKKFNMTTAEDATTIFYYDGTKLTNLSSGMCNGVTGSTWAWVVGESASTVNFLDGHTNGGYGIQTANAYFYDNGDGSNSADRGTDVNMSSGNSRYRSWELTEITTSLPITLNDGGDENYYATLCLPCDVTISEGTTAYTLSISGSWAVPTAVTSNQVPAGTPVLLKGTSATATATINTGVSFGSAIGNALTGTYAAIDISSTKGSDYYLGRYRETDSDPYVVGFYHWDQNVLSGFRAYLTNATVSGSLVKGFAINWGGETGVESIEHSPLTIDHEAGAMFDLSGRRVSKAQKGLYIQNGKKVMVK